MVQTLLGAASGRPIVAYVVHLGYGTLAKTLPSGNWGWYAFTNKQSLCSAAVKSLCRWCDFVHQPGQRRDQSGCWFDGYLWESFGFVDQSRQMCSSSGQVWRLGPLDVEDVMHHFPCQVKEFPCTYLGLPLHFKQIRRVDIQPLIDKLGNRLPAWRGSFLTRAGRLHLMTTVLSAMPTYFFMVFALKKWVIKKIDKIGRGFLLKGSDDARGGHCLVCWAKVKRPKSLGDWEFLT